MPPKRYPKRLSGFVARVDPGRILAGLAAAPRGSGGAPVEEAAVKTNIQNNILVEPERRRIPSTSPASGSAGPLPLADRADRPSLSYTKRGSYSVAAPFAATAESRSEALAALEDGFYANSLKRPRASYLRTWEKMHREWFGESIPVLPLPADKLKAVGPCSRQGSTEESQTLFAV